MALSRITIRRIQKPVKIATNTMVILTGLPVPVEIEKLTIAEVTTSNVIAFVIFFIARDEMIISPIGPPSNKIIVLIFLTLVFVSLKINGPRVIDIVIAAKITIHTLIFL